MCIWIALGFASSAKIILKFAKLKNQTKFYLQPYFCIKKSPNSDFSIKNGMIK